MQQPDAWTCPRCRTSYLACSKEPRFPRRTWGLVCSACHDETVGAFRWCVAIAIAVIITYFALNGAA